MEDQKMKVLYEEHEQLIHKAVWVACRKFPDIPREEILSEANFNFCRCYRYWKSEKKVKFSTYLSQSLKKAFSNCQWYMKPVGDEEKFHEQSVNGMCGPERLVRLKQALSNMKPLALEIVNKVFNPPTELRTLTKEGLRRYLRQSGIGDAGMISEAFLEIKQTLGEV